MTTDWTEVAARVKRFALLLDMEGAEVTTERDAVSLRTNLVLSSAAPPVIVALHYADNIAATGHPASIPVSIMGRPGGSAPNPAINKREFLEWLKKLLSSRDLSPKTSLSRADWISQHGHVPQCFKCGLPMREITTRDGNVFWGCTGFRSDGCKGSLNIDEDGNLSPRCPDCGHAMALRNSAKGYFWSCGGYPGCKRTMDKSVGDQLATTIEDWLPDDTGRREATAVTGRPAVPLAGSASAGLPTSSARQDEPAPPAGSGAKPTIEELRARFKRRL